MKASIALIGAGRLGSRHLQGILKMAAGAVIHVVDPDSGSLGVARERASEIEHDHEVRFDTDPSSLPPTIDIATVATTAHHRRPALEHLLMHHSVRHVVLEKVVFPDPEDFEAVRPLLRRCGCRAWVNFVRRCWPVYRDLAGTWVNAPCHMIVHGGEWGLSTSGLHFLDLFHLLAGRLPHSIDASGLDPEPIPSRHPGMLEFTGRLVADYTDGSSVSLVSQRGSTAPVRVHIAGLPLHAVIAEDDVAFEHRSKSPPLVRQTRTPYQSELSGPLHDDLLEDRCSLTDYETAARLHRLFLPALLAHANAHGGSYTTCPIT